MSSTEIEKKSLEAHVELCAERYAGLDKSYKALDSKLEALGRITMSTQKEVVVKQELVSKDIQIEDTEIYETELSELKEKENELNEKYKLLEEYEPV